METSYASIDDEKYRLPIQRPWLTLLATRMVGGYYLSLDPPSSVSVDLALHREAIGHSRRPDD